MPATAGGLDRPPASDDAMFDWRFVALSHNTVRGAAGGAVLTAELLTQRRVSVCEVSFVSAIALLRS